MATQITAGKILRRGVESLGNDAMEYLLKNKEQVQRINDDFDSRRTALIEQHATTQAEIAKLEKKEAGLSARTKAVVKDRADLDKSTVAAEAKHRGGQSGDTIADFALIGAHGDFEELFRYAAPEQIDIVFTSKPSLGPSLPQNHRKIFAFRHLIL